MDMLLIQSTITGLKTASDIAKSLLELKSISDVQSKVIDLQSAILSAQSSALAANSDQAVMAEQIRTLKEEMVRVKAWETEKQHYTLVAPWTGGLAYALKESMKKSEPPHYICTRCYEDGRKSILNQKKDLGGWTLYLCPICKSEIPTYYRGGVAAEYAPD